MTPEQHRRSAANAIQHFARTIERDDVFDHTDGTGDGDDVRAIAGLIRTATVEITWPDEVNPEPAPAAFRETGPGLNGEWVGLTAAQEIRLGVFTSLTDEFTEPDKIRDVLAMVVRAGQVIETGELDGLEDACAEDCPGREELAEANADAAEALRIADANHILAGLCRIAAVLDAVGASLPASDLHDLRAALEWEPEPTWQEKSAADLKPWTDGFQKLAEVITPRKPTVDAADPGGLLNDSGVSDDKTPEPPDTVTS